MMMKKMILGTILAGVAMMPVIANEEVTVELDNVEVPVIVSEEVVSELLDNIEIPVIENEEVAVELDNVKISEVQKWEYINKKLVSRSIANKLMRLSVVVIGTAAGLSDGFEVGAVAGLVLLPFFPFVAIAGAATGAYVGFKFPKWVYDKIASAIILKSFFEGWKYKNKELVPEELYDYLETEYLSYKNVENTDSWLLSHAMDIVLNVKEAVIDHK